MRVSLHVLWLPLAVIVGGCQQSTSSPAVTVPADPRDRVVKVDHPDRDPFEDLDVGLGKEIRGWKKGDQPPARLLRFPDGPPASLPVCGMRVLGDDVGDYISRVTDLGLLEALLFDWPADQACVHSTARRQQATA